MKLSQLNESIGGFVWRENVVKKLKIKHNLTQQQWIYLFYRKYNIRPSRGDTYIKLDGHTI